MDFFGFCLFTAEYLGPDIGMAVWLLYIIRQVYADAIYIAKVWRVKF